MFTIWCCINEHMQPPAMKNRYFDDFDSFNASGTTHPVYEWLNSPVVAGADSLQWWYAMPTHPLRMAVKFLLVPGMFLQVLRHIVSCVLTVFPSYFHRCRECFFIGWAHCFKDETLIIWWINPCGGCHWFLVWLSWHHSSRGDNGCLQGEEQVGKG